MAFQKGMIPWNKGRKDVMPIAWNKGLKTPDSTKEKQRLAKLKNPVRYWKGKRREDMVQEKHWNWSRGKVSYRAIHLWVQKQKGKASECEFCGFLGVCHWHNFDRKYERDLSKFISLCPDCHWREHRRMRSAKI